MSAWLDIDDVTNGHPLAFNQLMNMRAELTVLEDENQRLRKAVTRVVAIADSDPFSTIGFVVEHSVPELRALVHQVPA